MTSCPLCGYEFDPAGENCHSGCPFAKGCNLLMCPACHYEFVTESKTVNLVKSLVKRGKGEQRDEAVSD